MAYYKKNTETHKECKMCSRLLTRTNFHKDSSRKDGITAYCKECKLKQNKKWAYNNPDKAKESMLFTRRKIEYGIKKEEFYKIMEKQNNCCGICKKLIDISAHVDHDHMTGKIRGLLCRSCNIGLGFFYDNPKTLEYAIEYINKSDLKLA